MITIVTPVLNGVSFLENNINSIIKLKIPFEHIIVDGGSTDGTLDLVYKYKHLKLINQKESNGMYHAIQLGFDLAIYDYITWINCDDLIFPDNLENALKIAYSKSYDFVYGDGILNWKLKSKKTYYKSNPFAIYFLKNNLMPFLQPSSFYKKQIYNEHKFNFVFFKIVGDLDFFKRIAQSKKYKFYYFRKPLSEFLKYGESLGDRNQELYSKEMKVLNIKNSVLNKLFYKLTKNF